MRDLLIDQLCAARRTKAVGDFVMFAKLKMVLSAALLLGTASAALADATEDYSNYPLANAYKYCDRGNAFACQQARRLGGEENARSAYGAAYPVTPAPVLRSRHRAR
jgi:hypothetical protein